MHPDTKNYTGAVFTLDERVAISESTKQKVNSRRSIESELNVIDDKISKTLLTKRCLECQIFKLMSIYVPVKVPTCVIINQ